jgi:chemotaxis protein CheD
LYDPVHRIMGMNHFLLSNRRYRKEGPLVTSEAGRYGIHAMELVINGMIKLGATRKYLKAKAFGGGNVLSNGDCTNNFFCVGEVNSRFIIEFLDNEKIPLVNSDLGGNNGRVIRFFGSDYSVYVRKIQKTESRTIVERDKRYWDKKVKEEEVTTTDIELW